MSRQMARLSNVGRHMSHAMCVCHTTTEREVRRTDNLLATVVMILGRPNLARVMRRREYVALAVRLRQRAKS
jgi:hypothetical protein